MTFWSQPGHDPLSYIAQGFGSLVCWNMATFYDAEYADPDIDPNTFAPTGLDVDNWLDAIVASGATYAVLTTKHLDGFCLWPTAYYVAGHDPYSIAETTWYVNNGSPDVVGIFVSGCNSRDLHPCLYFSMRDMTYEVRSGEAWGINPPAYAAMSETQLTELLTGYGYIYSIWFDSWGVQGYGGISYATIYNHIKNLSPSTYVLDLAHVHPNASSEVELWEQNEVEIPAGNRTPAERCETIRIDGHWFYHASDGHLAVDYKTAATIRSRITLNNSRCAAYLLACTPSTAGILPPAQVMRLVEV